MRGAAWLVASVFFAACGRPTPTERSLAPTQASVRSFGLRGAVAIVDEPGQSLVLLVPGPNRTLEVRRVDVGGGDLTAAASADGRFLFVASTGAVPRLSPDDARPRLTIIDAKADPRVIATQDLSIARDGLAVDPAGRYLVLYATGNASAILDNPNELLLVDLAAEGEPSITPLTLRSFGGKPQRLSFTQELLLPSGTSRLLAVETEQDLTLLPLDRVDRQVTVRLSTPSSPRALKPSVLVVDDGEAARGDDARLAARLEGEESVLLLTLEAGKDGAPFTPRINLLDTGGEVSDLAFVRTDAGLRLAALLGARSTLSLIVPETGLRDELPLPARYDHLSLVASAPGAEPAALLAGDGVALWTPGISSARPFASVETLSLPEPIEGVIDVPGQAARKLLRTKGKTLFVVDLLARSATPLLVQRDDLILGFAPGGGRMWAHAPRGLGLALVELGSLSPRTLLVDKPIGAVYSIASNAGAELLVALHESGTFAATVFDAAAPDDGNARLYSNLLLGGRQ